MAQLSFSLCCYLSDGESVPGECLLGNRYGGQEGEG